MFSANEILDMAVKVEKNGEAVYRNAIAKVAKPEFIGLLEWMADEEVKHANFFSNLKLELETNGVNPFIDEMSRELFDDLLGERISPSKKLTFPSLKMPTN